MLSACYQYGLQFHGWNQTETDDDFAVVVYAAVHAFNFLLMIQ